MGHASSAVASGARDESRGAPTGLVGHDVNVPLSKSPPFVKPLALPRSSFESLADEVTLSQRAVARGTSA